MKKNFFMTVIFLMAVPFLFSQGLTLEKVCAEFSQHPVTAGTFFQTKTIRSIQKDLKSQGTFVFCDESIIWKTEKPFPSVLAIGSDVMVQVGADGKKTVTDVSGNETFKSISSALISVFSNDIEILKKSFDIIFTETGGGNWNASLFPKDKTIASVIDSIKLSGILKDSDGGLHSVLICESGGDTIAYAFSDLKYPEELSADEKAIFNRQ